MNENAVAPARTRAAAGVNRGLLLILILWLVAMAAAGFVQRWAAFYLVLGGPLALLVVTNPKLAIYQFIIVAFIWRPVIPNAPLLLADVSALLVIGAALLDVLLGNRLPQRLPAIGIFYGAVVSIMAIVAIFSYDPGAALRPIARVGLLGVTFLALYRLSRYVAPSRVLSFFFWLGTAHSLVALVQFILSGGALRSFGYSPVVLDDIIMVLLPVGVAFYLWSPKHRLWYLLASAVILGGLIGTQSRAPIAFGIIASVLVIIISWRRTRRTRSRVFNHGVQNKIGLVAAVCVAVVIVGVFIEPGLFMAVVNRFDNLFSLSPVRTFAYRVYLWEHALRAFVDHPLTGLGPGMFARVGEIYASANLHPMSWHLRGMSAHNMILHYLAETGLAGGVCVLSMFVANFVLCRRVWRSAWADRQPAVALGVYAIGLVLLLTALIEGGWMWGGQIGFVGGLLFAIAARTYRLSRPA